MKTIHYNRQTHPGYFRTAKNFGHLIALIEQEGEKDKSYVVHLKLNGKSVDKDEESLLHKMNVQEVKNIEVQMGGLSEILKQSLVHLMHSLQHIQGLCLRFVREFRSSGQVDDDKVKFILIETRELIEALEEIFRSHTSGKWTLRHPSLWRQSEQELTLILHSILQARELTSPDLLLDLLEDSFVQALDSWEETLERELIDNQNLLGIIDLKSKGDSSDNGVDV